VNSLATALGARLTVELAEGDEPAWDAPAALPDSLVQFSRSRRFSAEAQRLAATTRAAETLVRERLLHAMAAMASVTTRPLSEVYWHRVLDAAVLIARD
jgi:hypothetical protein